MKNNNLALSLLNSANQLFLSLFCIFIIVQPIAGEEIATGCYAIKSASTGKYLTGNIPMVFTAKADQIGDGEKFYIEKLYRHRISSADGNYMEKSIAFAVTKTNNKEAYVYWQFKSLGNGIYEIVGPENAKLRVEPLTGLISTYPESSDNSKWRFEAINDCAVPKVEEHSTTKIILDGCYAIKAAATDRYLSHNGSIILPYTADREEIQAWEKFYLRKHPWYDKYLIYGEDKNFISCQPFVIAKVPVADDWEWWNIGLTSTGDYVISGQSKSFGQDVFPYWMLTANILNYGEFNFDKRSAHWVLVPTTGCPQGPPPLPEKVVALGPPPGPYAGIVNFDKLNSQSKHFNGTTDFETLPGTYGGEGWDEFTIEGWIKCEGSTGDFQSIVSSKNLDFVHLQLHPSGNNLVYLNDGRTISFPIIPVKTDGWHHIAMVIKSGDSRLYLNGLPVGDPDKTIFGKGAIKPSSEVLIGKGYNGGRPFKGKISNLRIWKVAHSQADILTLIAHKAVDNNDGLVVSKYFSRKSVDFNLLDNRAKHFNGTTDFEALPGVFGGDGWPALTIEAWIDWEGPTGDMQAIVSSKNLEFTHFQLHSSGSNMVFLKDGRAVEFPAIPEISNGWHHVAMVIQPAYSEIFLDGKRIGYNGEGKFGENDIKPSAEVYIGKGYNGGRFFKGKIADLRIWKTYRSIDSILDNLAETPLPGTPGLVVAKY